MDDREMDEETEVNRQKVKELNKDIDLCNAQIQELQQKLVDADQDENKNKSRWSGIHTMVEAKCALKYLLTQVCIYRQHTTCPRLTVNLMIKLIVIST